MKPLIRPKALKTGDTIAAVSLSWGGPGAFPKRYEYGKKQFENTFGLKIVEAPHTLCSPDELNQHPEWRLEDLMWAFKNPEIKGILPTIGGNDTIRLFSLMTDKDFQIIHDNPKVFMGMSDTTTNHFMCLKAGITSFYSPSLMFGYAENGGITQYIIDNTQNSVMSSKPIGNLIQSKEFIVDKVSWAEDIIRKREPTTPWRFIGSQNKVQGHLIGGCMDTIFTHIIDTPLFPTIDEFKDTILFLETSEDRVSLEVIEYWLRILGKKGYLNQIKGLLFARPGGEFKPDQKQEKTDWIKHYPDYDKVILNVLKEYNCDIPVVCNMDFGHTVPQMVLPYAVLCEINPKNQTVSLLESGVEE